MFLSLCRYLLAERRGLRRQVAQLAAKLEAERERNRQREDDLTSRWLTANGQYGIPSRQASSPAPSMRKPASVENAPLSALEEARLEAYIREAQRVGKTKADAEQLFYEQRGAKQMEAYSAPEGVF